MRYRGTRVQRTIIKSFRQRQLALLQGHVMRRQDLENLMTTRRIEKKEGERGAPETEV